MTDLARSVVLKCASAEDLDDEAWARLFVPVENETLRLTLGAERRELAKAIERWLPFVEYGQRERKSDRWIPALQEMRRGLRIISDAVRRLGPRTWEDLPMGVPFMTRRGREVEVRFFTPGEIGAAVAWLDFWLGPRRGAHRPSLEKDERVDVGAWLANIFDEYGEPVTLGRSGVFAQALNIVLETLGLSAPEDPLRLLRAIRARRARRHGSTRPAPRRQVR